MRKYFISSIMQPGKRKMETLLPTAVIENENLADVKKRAKLEESPDEDAEGDVTM